MTSPAPDPAVSAPRTRVAQRVVIVGLCFAATALCYIDRVSISIAIIPLAHQFKFDSAAQGVILSAFFWGYLWPQLLGGVMADRIGGYRVLAAGVAVWSLATIATPVAASISFAALLAARVILGLGEGVNFPAIHSLVARWMMPAERTRSIAVNFSGMYAGTIVALLLSPLVIAALGWPALFYISGAAGLVWLAAWGALGAATPEESRRITQTELHAITLARTAEVRTSRVPWAAIVREPAVWAIVLAHFCSNFGFNILLLWLPTYLHHTFNIPMGKLGAYSLIPWLATFFTINAGGWISDAMIARGVSTTLVRKTMQASAFSIGAVSLLFLPTASSANIAVALLTISASANGISQSAFGVNHLDVGPSYAGVLMGISNTVATIPGIVGVALAGIIVQASGSFAAVFYMIAAVYAVGTAGYLTFASGDRKL
jgi:ACS family sodium-dependent inorganic phosphate cotransporter